MIENVLERPSPRSPLLLPVRFVLLWTIKLIVLAFLAVRFLLRLGPVRYGLMVLVAVAGTAWIAAGGATPWQTRAGSADVEIISAPASGQLPPSPAAEQYLKSQAAFDALGMWEAMSDRLQRQLALGGSSAPQIQAKLDKAREEGRRYTTTTYVGGTPLEGGKEIFLYVVTMESPSGVELVPFVFTVGQDGKILSVK